MFRPVANLKSAPLQTCLLPVRPVPEGKRPFAADCRPVLNWGPSACRTPDRSNIYFGVGAGHERNRPFESRKAGLPACAFPLPFRLEVCSIPTYDTVVAAVYRRCPRSGGITRSTEAPKGSCDRRSGESCRSIFTTAFRPRSGVVTGAHQCPTTLR